MKGLTELMKCHIFYQQVAVPRPQNGAGIGGLRPIGGEC